MENNSNNAGAHAALIHAIAAIDACENFLAEARARIAPHLSALEPKTPAENFTQARYQQADRTRAQLENEIAEVEDAFGGDRSHPLAMERLEPLETMLEHVCRFMYACRAHLNAQDIDATYEVR
jgi:Tfp pilus assembly protein PilP